MEQSVIEYELYCKHCGEKWQVPGHDRARATCPKCGKAKYEVIGVKS